MTHKPIVIERFADNGEFSHYEVIDSKTGETLWTPGMNKLLSDEELNRLAIEQADYNIDAAFEEDKPVYVKGFKDAYDLSRKRIEELQSKVEFYRAETEKIREFVFNSKDIGYPTQSIFEAVTDKLESQNERIEELEAVLRWYADDGNYMHNDDVVASAWAKGKIAEKAKKILNHEHTR